MAVRLPVPVEVQSLNDESLIRVPCSRNFSQSVQVNQRHVPLPYTTEQVSNRQCHIYGISVFQPLPSPSPSGPQDTFNGSVTLAATTSDQAGSPSCLSFLFSTKSHLPEINPDGNRGEESSFSNSFHLCSGVCARDSMYFLTRSSPRL